MSEIKVNKITPRTNCGTTTLGDSGDSITVGGDLKSNSLKATDGGVIISQCGTTITLGASGDTVALASGASQTGFGSPGQLVDWQTGDIKTATFTAADGKGYFCNTSGGAFTVNLPAGSAGAVIGVVDFRNSFLSINLTFSPNGLSLYPSSINFRGNISPLFVTNSNHGKDLFLSTFNISKFLKNIRLFQYVCTFLLLFDWSVLILLVLFLQSDGSVSPFLVVGSVFLW